MIFLGHTHDYHIFIYRHDFERLNCYYHFLCSGLSDYEPALVISSKNTLEFINFGAVRGVGKRVESLLHCISVEEIIYNKKLQRDTFFPYLRGETDKIENKEGKKIRVILDMNYLLTGMDMANRFAEFQRGIADFCFSKPVTVLSAFFYEYIPQHPGILFPAEKNIKVKISESLTDEIQPDLFKGLRSQAEKIDSLLRHLLVKSSGSVRELLRISREAEGRPEGSAAPPGLSLVPDIIWIADREGVTRFNSKGKENFIGRPFYDICKITPVTFRDILDKFRDKNLEPVRCDSEAVSEGYWLETMIQPLYLKDRFFGILGTTRDISDRKEFITPEEVKETGKEESEEKIDPETLGITQREMEIIKHLLSGLQNKEIGAKLFIAEITVKKHLSNIYQKLNVRNRVELIRLVQGADFWKK